MAGRDPPQVRAIMQAFKTAGVYRFEPFPADTFTASPCPDAEITGIIRQVYHKYGHICDPHTACGFKDLNRERTSVVLAAASPAKFPDVIGAATGRVPTDPSLEALKRRPIVKHRLPAQAAVIKDFIAAHGM